MQHVVAVTKMKLKFKYKQESEIPAEQKSLYAKKKIGEDEWWVLDAEGAADEDRLSEFRENNKAMLKLLGVSTPAEATAKLQKLKDVDPDKYAEFITAAEKAEQERLKKEKGIEAAHAHQIETINANHQKALKTEQDKAAAYRSKLETTLVDNAIQSAAAKKGVVATALVDCVSRGKQVFRVNDEFNVVADVGGTARLNSEGKPLSIENWLDALAVTDKHLFGKSSGSGAGGGAQGGSHSGPNPYSKKSPNLYLQGKMEREQPEQAKALKAAADAEA